MSKPKARALLFGLNYQYCENGKLNGCINDVKEISKYISDTLRIPVDIYTDDVDTKKTSYDGIIQKLYDLAIQSYREKLDFVWIHYSGHGSYQRDRSGDETDGYDEGLVPSDYEKKGILIDDIINKVISSFNPLTQILFICDSCHSGSMLDLKYTWNSNRQSKIDNPKCTAKSKTILISGCMDNQTSADAWNLLGNSKHIGALTASVLKVLRKKPQHLKDVFLFVTCVRAELLNGGFEQYPVLSSSYDIAGNPCMIPSSANTTNRGIPSLPDAPKLIHPTSSLCKPTSYYEAPTTYYPQNYTYALQYPYPKCRQYSYPVITGYYI